jgi:endonuclease/exonuclease/phosphatase family metal-dependent hydrolase
MLRLATRLALLLGLVLVLGACPEEGGPTPDGALPDRGPEEDSRISDAAPPDDGAKGDGPEGDGPGADHGPSPDGPPVDGPVSDVSPAADLGPATGPFRVATFNCYCLKNDPAKRIKGIAAEIHKLKPHAVGLQEVCESLGSGGSDNFAKALTVELQALSGTAWEHRFAKTHVSWSAYDEGVGLLVPKGNVIDWGEKSLPQGNGWFPRKVIWARVGTSNGVFLIYSTHLTVSADAADRANQAKTIVALVNQHATTLPQVVVGDFNDWYGSLAVSAMKSGPPAFTESWGTKHPGSANPGLTCCYPSFGSRIDYIFVKSSALSSLDQVELAFDQPYQGQALSDHRGLFVQFKN